MLKAVNLVGFKDSGKTTAALGLIAALTALGIKPGAVKCSHHNAPDGIETDSAKLFAATEAAGFLSETTAATFVNARRSLLDFATLFDRDFLVVEGGKSFGVCPRLLLLRDPVEAAELGPDLALGTVGRVAAPGLPHFETYAEAADAVRDRAFLLPGLDCGACGRPNCRTLAAEIIQGGAAPADCAAMSGQVEVSVAGNRIPLNPFAAGIVAGTLRGMLSSLKGFGPGDLVVSIKE